MTSAIQISSLIAPVYWWVTPHEISETISEVLIQSRLKYDILPIVLKTSLLQLSKSARYLLILLKHLLSFVSKSKWTKIFHLSTTDAKMRLDWIRLQIYDRCPFSAVRWKGQQLNHMTEAWRENIKKHWLYQWDFFGENLRWRNIFSMFLHPNAACCS